MKTSHRNFKVNDEALLHISERFRALGVPIRLKLIMSLKERSLTVSQLLKQTGTTQANVSKHLQVLTKSGILIRRKEGLQVYYSISERNIFKLCELVCGSLKQHFTSQAMTMK